MLMRKESQETNFKANTLAYVLMSRLLSCRTTREALASLSTLLWLPPPPLVTRSSGKADTMSTQNQELRYSLAMLHRFMLTLPLASSMPVLKLRMTSHKKKASTAVPHARCQFQPLFGGFSILKATEKGTSITTHAIIIIVVMSQLYRVLLCGCKTQKFSFALRASSWLLRLDLKPAGIKSAPSNEDNVFRR